MPLPIMLQRVPSASRTSCLQESGLPSSSRISVFHQADERLAALQQAGEEGLLMWDESVIEKPESIALQGLCAVRWSKARRLKRIKPGYSNPPGGPPIFVPAMNWLAVLLLGRQGPPPVAAMRWWTTRGVFAQTGRDLEISLLEHCTAAWGRRLLHIVDRGFAASPWIGACLQRELRVLMRLPERLPAARRASQHAQGLADHARQAFLGPATALGWTAQAVVPGRGAGCSCSSS